MQNKADRELETAFTDGRPHSYTKWERALGEKPEAKWLEKQKQKKISTK